MRRLLTGCFVTLLLLLNTLIRIGPLMVFALFKLIAPGRWRDYASSAVMWIAETWAEIDKLIFRLCIPTQWDIRGGADLRGDTSYLVVSNHQSWVDIPALIQTLNRRTPFFKFFLKKELIWVPLLGLAWWGLDYPFMKRYSKAFLDKHPHLKGQDLAITKAACELFKRQPVTVVNYLEGTRFTEAKRQEQQSPYRYLLKPKAGGVAFVVGAMGEAIEFAIDLVHQRKDVYRQAGIAYYRPWIFVITDGSPTDSWKAAARAVKGERGIIAGGRDYRRQPVLAYSAAVAGSSWLMIAEIDEVEAYAGVRTLSWVVALVMGLGLLLVYSAGYQAWRRDWLLRWESGAEPDDPQAILWRAVAAGRSTRARRIQAYLARFAAERRLSSPTISEEAVAALRAHHGDDARVSPFGDAVTTVTTADVKQSNGVVHVIDKVLMP